MRLQPIGPLRNIAARYSRGTTALAIGGGYAAIVIGVAAFVAIDTALTPGSLAGIWLFLVTAPSSLLLHFIPAESIAFTLLLTSGGLVQAWLLCRILRGKRLPRSG